jgi:hypothetical protein
MAVGEVTNPSNIVYSGWPCEYIHYMQYPVSIKLSFCMQLRESLSSWTKPITDFEHLLLHSSGRGTTLEPLSMAVNTSQVNTADAHIFKSGIRNLLSAYAHHKGAQFNKAILNIELLAFALVWFGMVSGCCSKIFG